MDFSEFKKGAVLAPMAGIADSSMRLVCMKHGALMCVSEMVSVKGLYYNDKKSEELMRLNQAEYPCGIQLFGDEPNLYPYAIDIAMKYHPSFIDINMGCPVPKVVSNGCGSALMKNPKLVFEIVKSAVKHSPVPVSVKFRSGFDENNINATEIAKACEQGGADFITVHPRTKTQMYSGHSDWSVIRDVKSTVSIPVIGNGDILSGFDAKNMFDSTGCDLVMVGRGALGNPFIFREISEFLQNGILLPPPTLSQKLEVMKEHILSIVSQKGEGIGMKEARKHVGFYLKGIKNAAMFRNLSTTLNTLYDLDHLIEQIISDNQDTL